MGVTMLSAHAGFISPIPLINALNLHCLGAKFPNRHHYLVKELAARKFQSKNRCSAHLEEPFSERYDTLMTANIHSKCHHEEVPSSCKDNLVFDERPRRTEKWISRRAFGAISVPLIAEFTNTLSAAANDDKEARLMQRSGSGTSDSAEFYQKWRYAAAADILPYIFASAREGQVDEILDAMDEFGLRYPMYKLGHEKGLILEAELKNINPKPKVALELGTFLGYSAMRTARFLGKGGSLTCIEFNPEHSEVASKVCLKSDLRRGTGWNGFGSERRVIACTGACVLMADDFLSCSS